MKNLIVSDIHFHPWSIFSGNTSEGINTRLQKTMDELLRAAKVLRTQGGTNMIVAGDIFHARGSIDPEVLNPVRDTFEQILALGIDIDIIPGNHDLKSDDTKRLSSAVQNLAQITMNGTMLTVHNQAELTNINGAMFGFVPWRSTIKAMLQDLETLSKLDGASEAHVFIHAGIDGVLSGVPAHGLTAKTLDDFGFRSVFAGHYHNHADMSGGCNNRVMSIGATTHHNWGDIGTRAGFLILDTDTNEVAFHDNEAPKFVDVSGLSEEDMELECAGNYARFRGPQMTQEQVNELRDQLKTWGAVGVSIEVPRQVNIGRSTAPATGMSLGQSVDKFVSDIKDLPPDVERDAVAKRAQEVLNAAQAVSTEA